MGSRRFSGCFQSVKSFPRSCPLLIIAVLMPLCGGVRTRKGHVFKCEKCGMQTPAHLIACINILLKVTSD